VNWKDEWMLHDVSVSRRRQQSIERVGDDGVGKIAASSVTMNHRRGSADPLSGSC